MTKLWGPLGWMTLHSISLIYPERPTPNEKHIAARFIDLFAESISCIFCKTHFTNMYILYKSIHPEYLDSRQDFALFVFRAHNTVNKRLDKPRPSSVAECLRAIRDATKNTTLKQFRDSYLNYLIRNWGSEFSTYNLAMRHCVNEMVKIENEYWSPRELTSIPELAEADITTPIEKQNARPSPKGQYISTIVGFRGGRLKLGSR